MPEGTGSAVPVDGDGDGSELAVDEGEGSEVGVEDGDGSAVGVEGGGSGLGDWLDGSGEGELEGGADGDGSGDEGLDGDDGLGDAEPELEGEGVEVVVPAGTGDDVAEGDEGLNVCVDVGDPGSAKVLDRARPDGDPPRAAVGTLVDLTAASETRPAATVLDGRRSAR